MSKDFVTNDIGLAAYLLMKKMSLLECKIEKSGKYFFRFSDSQSQAYAFSLEFINSECNQFDNHLRNLRKLLNLNKV